MKTLNTPSQIASLPAKIQIGYLSNTSRKCYHWSACLVKEVTEMFHKCNRTGNQGLDLINFG